MTPDQKEQLRNEIEAYTQTAFDWSDVANNPTLKNEVVDFYKNKYLEAKKKLQAFIDTL